MIFLILKIFKLAYFFSYCQKMKMWSSVQLALMHSTLLLLKGWDWRVGCRSVKIWLSVRVMFERDKICNQKQNEQLFTVSVKKRRDRLTYTLICFPFWFNFINSMENYIYVNVSAVALLPPHSHRIHHSAV